VSEIETPPFLSAGFLIVIRNGTVDTVLDGDTGTIANEILTSVVAEGEGDGMSDPGFGPSDLVIMDRCDRSIRYEVVILLIGDTNPDPMVQDSRDYPQEGRADPHAENLPDAVSVGNSTLGAGSLGTGLRGHFGKWFGAPRLHDFAATRVKFPFRQVHRVGGSRGPSQGDRSLPPPSRVR
jgi:hypothetical protein